LNPHALRHVILSHAWLPLHHVRKLRLRVVLVYASRKAAATKTIGKVRITRLEDPSLIVLQLPARKLGTRIALLIEMEAHVDRDLFSLLHVQPNNVSGPAVVRRLRMTIRADKPEVLRSVVGPVTVLVVNLKDQRLPSPLCQRTDLTLILSS
jgi:hypothetical protein